MKSIGPLSRAARYAGALRGNARVCIAFHPLWGIPYTLYYFYLSLYMGEFGVTSGQLGVLMLAYSFSALLFSLIAAPVVDRMGRRNATLWFDLISSALPALLYLLSGSFLVSLAATVLSGANRVLSTAYYLVMTEDAGDTERMVAFNLFNLITVASGLLIPLAGLLIERVGLKTGERIFLAASLVCFVTLALCRHRLIKETRAGLSLQKAAGGNRSGPLLAPYRDALFHLRENHEALAVILANILFYVYYSIGTTNSLFFTPYFSDALGFTPAEASVFGAVYSVGMLFSMAVINPLTQRLRLFTNLLLGAAVNAAGALLMAVAPAGSAVFTLLAVLLTALGYGCFKSVLDAAMVIVTGERYRSGAYSLTNLASSLLGMGASGLCGLLYPQNPRFVYLLSAGLLTAVIVCFIRALSSGKGERRPPLEESA